ncbi:MAG: extensin family protein [Deltaproteobacteria bacterium]|nr:extensin family protein [Deltaproteobacteria bacterium]MBK8718753.1 extensin family protein [Deltaproteobacteria bacterium]MBP7286463.1 extensin family protein [Nannocystaceae bacterium]
MTNLLTTWLLVWLAAAPVKRPNMPVGWTWPPSKAMKSAGERCLRRLDDASQDYHRAEPVKAITTPVTIPALALGELSLVPLKGKGSYPMDCHLAAALRDVAPALAQLGVAALGFRTLHEYRRVRKHGRTTNILSRHALGLAIDVFEVRLDDGRVLQVERDWADEPLLPLVVAVFEGADAFRTPLTPANDPDDHGDHVHLEAHMRIDP